MKFLAVSRTGIPLATFRNISDAIDLWKLTGAHHVIREDGEVMTKPWSANNAHSPVEVSAELDLLEQAS